LRPKRDIVRFRFEGRLPMQAALTEIEQIVTDVSKRTVLGPSLHDVHVEQDAGDDGEELLRVSIDAGPLDNVSDDDLVNLIQQIEDAVAEKDSRFPIVHFADAA
jgi:nicotinate-nucleotide pyrophosphorylase